MMALAGAAERSDSPDPEDYLRYASILIQKSCNQPIKTVLDVSNGRSHNGA